MSLSKPKVDGDFHGRLTVAASPIAAAVGLAYGLLATSNLLELLPYCLAGWVGCLTGLILEPDLDQENMLSSSEHRFVKAVTTVPILGHILAGVWMGLWFIYGFLIPHRHPISHWPVLGTIIRVMVVWVPLQVVSGIVCGAMGWESRKLLPDDWLITYVFFVGLCISDFTHWGRDTYGWQI